MTRLMEVTGGSQAEMNKLFSSVEAANGALILAKDASGTFAAALEKNKDIAGIVADAYAAMADTFDKINQRLITNADVIMIQVGDALLATYGAIVDGIKKILQGISTGIDEGSFDPILKYFADKGAEMAKLFQDIAAALPKALDGLDWSGLIDSFDELEDSIVTALKNIFGEIDITTPEGLQQAIQTIIDALTQLNNATGGIIEGLTPFVEGMVELGQAFLEMDADTIKQLGEALGSLTAINELAALGGEVASILGGIGDALKVLTAATVITGINSLAGAMGVGATAGLAGAFSGLAAVAGPAVTAIAAAWAAWEIGKYAWETLDLGDAVMKFLGIMEEAPGSIDMMGKSLEDIRASTGLNIQSAEELQAAYAKGEIIFDKVSQTWVLAADAAVKMGEGTGDASGNVETLTSMVLNADGTFSTYTRAIDSSASALDQHGSAANAAERDTEGLKDQLQELASDERIKYMEFKMELDVETVKANASVAVAAFESLGVTIGSTGDLLGRLYGLITDDKLTDFEKSKIWEQIQKENEIRLIAVELQKELTEVQIEYMRARTEAMQKEGAMVTIDGAGLQPHLEAFMWEVLAAIQVRVNQEGLEMLVGI
jgi:hypothetical protein